MRAHPLCEKHRDTTTPGFCTPHSYGCVGWFVIPGPEGITLRVMASDGSGWADSGLPGPPFEHVSVSTSRRRTPKWREMEFVREQFWEDHETVIQFSVPRDKHVNNHQYTLHMWRPVGVDVPLPPGRCV